MNKQSRGMVRTGIALLTAGFVSASVAVPVVVAADGKALYETNCVTCHGAAGKGDGAAGQFLDPKPADFSKVLPGKTDADIVKVVKEGGPAVGKSPLMAGFGGRLSDEEIDAIVAYIKGFAK